MSDSEGEDIRNDYISSNTNFLDDYLKSYENEVYQGDCRKHVRCFNNCPEKFKCWLDKDIKLMRDRTMKSELLRNEGKKQDLHKKNVISVRENDSENEKISPNKKKPKSIFEGLLSKCDVCLKEFWTESDLKSHKDRKCDVCLIEFSTEYDLKLHKDQVLITGMKDIKNKAQCSKIGKKCNFKSTKTHFLLFQKWQKINFSTRKSLKLPKMQFSDFFLVQKLFFFAIFENANNVFLYFFLILEHCVRVTCTRRLVVSKN